MKKLLKKFLYICGFEIHNLASRKQYMARLENQKTKWLENFKVRTVIDVGANNGDFALKINKICPDAMIYSFEPLKDCYEDLIRNLSHLNKFKAFNLALGDEKGVLEFFRNNFTPSSSFLEMEELHKQSFLETGKTKVVNVNIERLDDIQNELILEKPILLKLDVQGYEEKVIKGSLDLLKKVDILIVEATLMKLYKEQLLFDGLYKLLTSLGFSYQGDMGQIRSPIDGRILQIDGIFIKNSTLNEIFN